ncbi:nuclear hormone receptor HR96 isoform X1 [Frankliniella occidentalis]|uniref:Nuclear hormone receptor HR96 isoform X1 n=1 Tax=Frankliniella occidentalis TaxID=133901 RepID=A0A6J1SMI9_FRAOC|nr:nuclear hormone receptor HR96 isoform X3 [Frankliniella occidentalis]XP_052131390.1 nuclear hormone receptor HR96 isoform X1 [Frankliniella occidentalis]
MKLKMSSDSNEVLDDRVEVKTEAGSNGSKVCSVCGDLAHGYNFNALTCESCKAFFRRNALKAKEFKCPFSESCVMTAITRRFCQKCRLQKCFTVGMRKEYIMSEEERLNKRQKVELNRAKKRAAASSDDNPGAAVSKRRVAGSKQHPADSDWNAASSDWSHISESQTSPGSSQAQDGSPPQSDSLSQRLLESFPSPTSASSAGSVPSPNSPPDSATVAASQNTEMVALRDTGVVKKQSMISVITYPHQLSKNPESNEEEPEERGALSDSKVSISTSTQTELLSNSGLKTVSTQTLDLVQPVSQSTPLLSSLICSKRSDEETGTRREASTSPPPQQDSLYVVEGKGDWTGVDGVNATSGSWDSCTTAPYVLKRSVDEDILHDVFRMSNAPNSFESILSDAIKLEFSTYTPRTLSVPYGHPEGHLHNKELNDAERAKLNELIVANKALLAPMEETNPDHCLLDIINLTAVAIRRLVKMAKKINAFKNMCQEDQVALLKGACMEMLILHSVTTYNPEKDSWALPHSNAIKVDVLKECKGNLYQEHKRFQQSFDSRWRTDENIMLILSAITLFTPARANVVHEDVIKLEQNSYYYLLRRYLECILPGCEARSTFLKLIQKISELHRLNEEHVRAYLDVDPSEVEPLLIEIFDLKSHAPR